MSLIWRPQGLNAAIERGFAASLRVAALDASAHSPSSRAGASAVQTSATVGGLNPTGELGSIMEKGAKPHTIAPKVGEVLFLKSLNVVVSGSVHHPGSAPKPYLGPAAMRWATGGFQATTRGSLALSGYR